MLGCLADVCRLSTRELFPAECGALLLDSETVAVKRVQAAGRAVAAAPLAVCGRHAITGHGVDATGCAGIDSRTTTARGAAHSA